MPYHQKRPSLHPSRICPLDIFLHKNLMWPEIVHNTSFNKPLCNISTLVACSKNISTIFDDFFSERPLKASLKETSFGCHFFTHSTRDWCFGQAFFNHFRAKKDGGLFTTIMKWPLALAWASVSDTRILSNDKKVLPFYASDSDMKTSESDAWNIT